MPNRNISVQTTFPRLLHDHAAQFPDAPTETAVFVCLQPGNEAGADTVGVPIDGVELKFDTSGQLVVRSRGLLNGHYKNPEAFAEVLTPDDWYRTGDAGFPDAGGNLMTGAYTRKDCKAAVAATLQKVYTYFPRLKTRRTSQAAYTSGGEQQMCAIGRALMASPTMVLLDEPSMGLAPQIAEEVFEIVKDLNQREKVTFLLAEQNTNMALRYADYGYILESGRIVMDGPAASLRENEDVKEFCLGKGGGDRKSFKDGKSYKRRKRWLS